MNEKKFQTLYKNTHKEDVVKELYWKCKANIELSKQRDEANKKLQEANKEIERLNNIINKAIEYLESYNTDFKNCRFGEAPISIRELGDLLDILKGSDKE